MNEIDNRSENGFTFDTCIGIKLCENPNWTNFLTCAIGFDGSKIHLSSQTKFEARNLGYAINRISEKIQKMGAQVILGQITERMNIGAKLLETKCPTLHAGDSQILAYALATATILVTCDRKLAEAANLVNVSVVNPDLLPCDEFETRSKSHKGSKLRNIPNSAMTISKETKDIVRSTLLKPGEKIVWRAFN